VNNRDLKTLAVDLAQFERLASLIPSGALKVAESGISGLADAARMADAGADAVLVGEALVKDGDPAAAIKAMRSLG
jgi:indole-3-glycerol phosphate synthase